jgi:hypothetical protein
MKMAREFYSPWNDRKDTSNQEVPLYRTLANGQRERITSFQSQEELLKVMDLTHPDTGESMYQKSEAFRRSVERIMDQTDAAVIGVQTEPRSPIPDDATFLQGLREDALRQRYAEMVDKAGGNDAVAKYELAHALVNPQAFEPEWVQQMQDTHLITDPSASRPMEQYLRSRKDAGLGPQVDRIAVFNDRDAEYEARKEQEALDFLDNEQDIAIGGYEAK